MPGIVGLVTRIPRVAAEQQLLRMLGTIRHGPSYATGTWMNESLGVYLGWTARKDSFSDGMPLTNERGDVVLIFSGEDYPDPGSIRLLKKQGHEFQTGDSSYLVHLSEEDLAFPACLNGRFHGLLANLASGKLTLFNDRYGMHRLYFHESRDAFYFAAEAKAIVAARPELRRANLQSLGEFVACGCVLENRTLFEGIDVLPPASKWHFRQRSRSGRTSHRWIQNPITKKSAESSRGMLLVILMAVSRLRCPSPEVLTRE